jgi:glycosyltransferase involved in cell wall biosynthesis
MDFPRVLIISHNALSDTQNNGKTITSLFCGWPKDRLAQLYLWPEMPDMTICDNFYRITDYEVLGGILRFKKADGVIISNEMRCNPAPQLNGIAARLFNNKGDHDGGRGLNKLIYTLFKNKCPAAILLRDLLWNTGVWDTHKFREWLKIFAPELIFYQSSNCCFAFDIVFKILERNNIPLIMQVTDDYVTARLLKSPLGLLYHILLKSRFKEVVSRAFCVLPICDAMQAEYSRRFGGRYGVFMNCVDIPGEIPQKRPQNDVVRFLYAGSLHTNRWKTLRNIGRALEGLNSESVKSSFDIYCNNKPDEKILAAIDIPGTMQYCGRLSSDELKIKIQEYDVLVHVEAFDKKSIHAVRLSLSTKIPEYLSKGISILAVGPPEAASIRYIRDEAAGIVATRQDIPSLREILSAVITDEAFRRKSVERAFELAKRRHDAVINRKRLKEIILECLKET